MVAATANPRGRSGLSAQRARPTGLWVAAAVALVLLALFVWQLVSPVLRQQVIVHAAASIGRVTLVADPAGTRVDVVIVDRTGQDTSAEGTMDVRVREPDGAVWRSSRHVSTGQFTTIDDGGLLAGRLGYSLVVPASDWARPPRHGGTATVNVTFTPASGGAPITSVEDVRFP